MDTNGLKLDIKKNDFSLGTIQSFGQAKQSYDEKYISNGIIDNIIPYDSNDLSTFYFVSNLIDTPTNCDKWHLKDKTYDDNCNIDLSTNTVGLIFLTKTDKSGTMYDTIKKDFGYNIPLYCYKRELCKNRDYGNTFINKNNLHSTSVTNYLDDKTNYNIQIINTANLCVGIILITGTLYVYRK